MEQKIHLAAAPFFREPYYNVDVLLKSVYKNPKKGHVMRFFCPAAASAGTDKAVLQNTSSFVVFIIDKKLRKGKTVILLT